MPPTSSFRGPPCSVSSKTAGQLRRRTYCAIKSHSLHIQAFESSGSIQHSVTSKKSPELRDQLSPVSFLDVSPNDGPDQVLVVQQNGTLTIFAEDLGTTISEAALRPQDQPSMTIMALQHLTLPEAQKTVLKQRSDLISQATQETSYLVLAYCKGGDGKSSKNPFYGVWSIGAVAQKAWASEKPILPIFEHELPMESGVSNPTAFKDSQCNFGHLASHLYVKSGATLLTYELLGLMPSLSSALHTGLTGRYDIMAISPTFAICSFQDSLRLYDLKYQSIQAQIDTRRMNLKRKRIRMTSEFQTGLVEFVTYFRQSARIIGKRQHQLFAIDLSSTGRSQSLLESGSKLLHNIGRGIVAQDSSVENTRDSNIGSSHTSANPGKLVTWQPVRKRLDQLAQADDVSGFEDTFLDDIRGDSRQSSAHSMSSDELPPNRFGIPDTKITYLMSKIFQMDRNPAADNNGLADAAKLRIQLPSRRLILWLSQLGLLSLAAVQRAVSLGNPGSGEHLPAHALTYALLEADPDRGLLVECLENGFSPYVEEQAAVVQVLLKQALDLLSEASVPIPAQASREVDAPEHAKTDRQVQYLSASTSDPSWLPPQLQRALIVALDRFGASTTPTISSHLRALFTQTEVLALVQFLRQQLFQGGHTRSFQSLRPMEVAGNLNPTVNIDAVVRVLSSCIDAIGPLGFFGALDNEDFIGNIVPDLVTEILHATQSLGDAAELQGILRETLRYEESMRKHQAVGARLSVQGRETRMDQQSGGIVTVYSEAFDAYEGLQNRECLPLTLRADDMISAVKVRKGGGQASKRSRRETDMLERRQKGQYSYERLIL